uniref:WD repeat-containing protein 65 n=1 Tax=Lygus hesperus TaxID=30085 RepID=A0A0A9WMZ1_LYGHE
MLHQLELDMDCETMEMGTGYQHTLDTLRTQFLKKKSDTAITRKNLTTIAKEIRVRDEEMTLLTGAHAALQVQLESCQHAMNQLRQDIEERDGVIAAKEKVIFDRKRDAQQLEKYKFVLDHTIR